MSEAGWEKLCRTAGSGRMLWCLDGDSVLRQLPVQQPAELISLQLAGRSRVALARQVSGMVPDSMVPLVLVIGGMVTGSTVPLVLVISPAYVALMSW